MSDVNYQKKARTSEPSGRSTQNVTASGAAQPFANRRTNHLKVLVHHGLTRELYCKLSDVLTLEARNIQFIL